MWKKIGGVGGRETVVGVHCIREKEKNERSIPQVWKPSLDKPKFLKNFCVGTQSGTGQGF